MEQPCKSYKPEGFQALIPYFTVKDADAFIRFVQNAFAARQLSLHRNPEGAVRYAALRIADSVLEVSEARQEYPAVPMTLHLYVEDTDDSYRRALQQGATSLMEPADMDYGERSGGVKDAFGNSWYIATLKEELSPATLV